MASAVPTLGSNAFKSWGRLIALSTSWRVGKEDALSALPGGFMPAKTSSNVSKCGMGCIISGGFKEGM